MISYEAWVDHCKFIKQKADATLEESKKIRESMYVPRERARNDLKAQNDSTNFALRKRIYETQRIKNELDWQRLNVNNTIYFLLIFVRNSQSEILFHNFHA